MITDPAIESRVSALLEELMDLVKPDPSGCGDPGCMIEHDDIPNGPWMISGWALVVDLVAESRTPGEGAETWTRAFHSKSLPWTQCVGMGIYIQKWAGG